MKTTTTKIGFQKPIDSGRCLSALFNHEDGKGREGGGREREGEGEGEVERKGKGEGEGEGERIVPEILLVLSPDKIKIFILLAIKAIRNMKPTSPPSQTISHSRPP